MKAIIRNKLVDNQCRKINQTDRLISTLCTVPKTPEPRALIFFSSDGLKMRAWTLVPFSPGPSGSKLYEKKTTIYSQMISLPPSAHGNHKRDSSWQLMSCWMLSKVSPPHSQGTSAWLSCDGWQGLGGTAHPGKTTPGRRSSQPAHLKLYLWSDRCLNEAEREMMTRCDLIWDILTKTTSFRQPVSDLWHQASSSIYSPAGGNTHLLTASLTVSKQSLSPGPEHLQQQTQHYFQHLYEDIHRQTYIYT